MHVFDAFHFGSRFLPNFPFILRRTQLPFILALPLWGQQAFPFHPLLYLLSSRTLNFLSVLNFIPVSRVQKLPFFIDKIASLIVPSNFSFISWCKFSICGFDNSYHIIIADACQTCTPFNNRSVIVQSDDIMIGLSLLLSPALLSFTLILTPRTLTVDSASELWYRRLVTVALLIR